MEWHVLYILKFSVPTSQFEFITFIAARQISRHLIAVSCLVRMKCSPHSILLNLALFFLALPSTDNDHTSCRITVSHADYVPRGLTQRGSTVPARDWDATMTWPIRTGMPPLYHHGQLQPMEKTSNLASNGQTHPSAFPS
jgi:hypothetical protein